MGSAPCEIPANARVLILAESKDCFPLQHCDTENIVHTKSPCDTACPSALHNRHDSKR